MLNIERENLSRSTRKTIGLLAIATLMTSSLYIKSSSAQTQIEATSQSAAPFPGHFIFSGQLFDSSGIESIASGDIDGDGDIDLVDGTFFGEDNSVFINNGSAIFTPGQKFGNFVTDDGFSGSYTFSVKLHDFDEDGDLDILSLRGTQNTNVLYTNDGHGNFTEGQHIGKEGWYNDAGIGDIDGDGDDDIYLATQGVVNKNFTGNEPAPDYVFLNDGKGNFTDSGQLIGTDSGYAVELADFENDGDLDALVAGFNKPGARVYQNTNGIFTPGQLLPVDQSQDVDVADINGDGYMDAAVGTMYDPDRIFINDGTGKLIERQKIADYAPFHIHFNDTDGDGDVDLFRAGQLYKNNGQGSFDLAQNIWDGVVYDMGIADFDGDGDPDLAVGVLGGLGNNHNLIFLNEPYARADIQVEKTVDTTSAHVGERVVYTIDVTNNGPHFASRLDLTDILPSGVTFEQGLFTSNVFSCRGSRDVTCDIGYLFPNDRATITMYVRPNSVSTITNTAEVKSIDFDPDLSNNSSTVVFDSTAFDTRKYYPYDFFIPFVTVNSGLSAVDFPPPK